MRPVFKKRHIIAAAVNAAAVAGALILTAAGSAAAKSQNYNYAADRWNSTGKKDYTQISCFFSEDAGFTKNSIKSVKGSLMSKLEEASITPEEGKTLIPDAYSTRAGRAEVTCDIVGRTEAEITAVGGEFFLFHEMRLLSGSYISDSDIMQDGAVIDRQLAWLLYGSENVIGMNIYINNVKLYIAGVTDTPSTDPEERCAGDTPRAYISYYAAGQIFGGGDEGYMGMSDPSESFTKITCYECIVPDPVENFAYSALDKQLSETYKGHISIVNNSERFDSKKRAKALKKLDEYAVRSDDVVYPYWENASRLVEVRLSLIYGARRLLLAIPFITLVWLVIKAYRTFMRKKEGLKKAVGRSVSAKWRALKGGFRKKAPQTTEKDS